MMDKRDEKRNEDVIPAFHSLRRQLGCPIQRAMLLQLEMALDSLAETQEILDLSAELLSDNVRRKSRPSTS